ncbi:MAG: hypothetical protein ACPGKG_03020 [Paracoccaceae bacterium]
MPEVRGTRPLVQPPWGELCAFQQFGSGSVTPGSWSLVFAPCALLLGPS